MKIEVFPDKDALGIRAAESGAQAIKDAVSRKGHAEIILATGASQFEMLARLVTIPDIPWNLVTAFHLDEYIGIPDTHPASFRKYLRERFAAKVPPLKDFFFIEGDRDPRKECAKLNALISGYAIDVAFVGIGENGHLAFNDPPADFDTTDPYLVVDLDDACRKQQMGEGWFRSLEDVPRQAISMGINQIMKSDTLIVAVPDRRKANAVKGAVDGPVTNLCPSSIMQMHQDCRLFLDKDSASLTKRFGGSSLRG
ncbi:MAG: glucosamine-6-phosphate deaminase [Rectinemataceae bacterium]